MKPPPSAPKLKDTWIGHENNHLNSLGNCHRKGEFHNDCHLVPKQAQTPAPPTNQKMRALDATKTARPPGLAIWNMNEGKDKK
jgi:hypothetical protein